MGAILVLTAIAAMVMWVTGRCNDERMDKR